RGHRPVAARHRGQEPAQRARPAGRAVPPAAATHLPPRPRPGPRDPRPAGGGAVTAPVRVTFLGGLGEIGRNCACIEVDGRILLLDVGLMFPELDMLGVDLVLPDFTYLRENADRVDGAVITHGHEDHMGGLSYLLREMSFPIYGSPLTLGLARNPIHVGGVRG